MGGLLTQLLFYQRRDSLFCFPYSFSQGNFTLTSAHAGGSNAILLLYKRARPMPAAPVIVSLRQHLLRLRVKKKALS
jgi:hypothetical protein